VDGLHVSGFYELTKRLLDIVGALFGLFFLPSCSPSWQLPSGWILGSPVLYSQDRLGKGGVRFKIYKFRSMRKDADTDGSPSITTMENDPRVTRVGAFCAVRAWMNCRSSFCAAG
jgi:lipopolysaccharide/colanic/teichoic acid biosynthesis glycosyltransferase